MKRLVDKIKKLAISIVLCCLMISGIAQAGVENRFTINVGGNGSVNTSNFTLNQSNVNISGIENVSNVFEINATNRSQVNATGMGLNQQNINISEPTVERPEYTGILIIIIASCAVISLILQLRKAKRIREKK